MSQKIINVGTVANDGTGDTIRGAFTNVNANFTEVYNNTANLTATLAAIDLTQNTSIALVSDHANAAYDQANTVNVLAYNIGTSANLYAVDVGTAGNAYAVAVGASSRTISNSYADIVGTAGNNYTNTVGAASNNYASILAANNAVGANAWSNTVAITTTNWANSKFETIANTANVLGVAEAAYIKANSALANTTGTFGGNLTVTGTVTDVFGALREKVSDILTTNTTIQVTRTVLIANNQDTIYIKVPNDNLFLFPPVKVGTTVEVVQYGTGNTTIMANDASVTINSYNNWANIAGQYLTVRLIKVKANTWVLEGNLKP